MSRNRDLKEENIYKIRSCFFDLGVWTKNTLSKKTGLSLATTTNVLQELIEKNEILYVGEADSTGGRKSKEYIFNTELLHLGMLILRKEGKRHILHAYSTNIRNDICEEIFVEKEEVFKEDIFLLLEDLFQKDPKIEILIISIPGVCEKGIVDISDYQNLEGISLTKELTERFHKPCIIENDVNVACIGFSCKCMNKQNIAFIYQPKEDYVGVGMVLNGKLYNGFSHFAGELRYCPFYTHTYQEEQTKRNPEELLMKQIGTLCTIINPEIVGYHSDCFKEAITTLQSLGIPDKHCPILVYVEKLEEEIQMGLYSIGLHYVKEKRGE